MATNEEAVELQAEFNNWRETYKIGEFLEDSDENRAKLEKMDPRYVWTDHGTCESTQVTSGYTIYAGMCCWISNGWYVGEVPWEPKNGDLEGTYISFDVDKYLSCPSCNPEGDEENIAENCPGDENFPDSECDEGYIQYYFD